MPLNPGNNPGNAHTPSPCDACNKPKTVHVTEISGGQKVQKDLCKDCPLVNNGLAGPAKSHQPINELLSNFVLAHSGTAGSRQHKQCDVCGTTWAKFKQNGLLGCDADYALFEEELTPLLKRAHEGATHHTGKIPVARRGTEPAKPKKPSIAKLRRELERAVAGEDYELAARLRDQIGQIKRVDSE